MTQRNNSLELRVNDQEGTVLIQDLNFPLLQDSGASVTQTLRSTQNGGEIELELSNPGDSPVPLGRIFLLGLDFGRHVTMGDFRHGSELPNRDVGGGAEGDPNWHLSGGYNSGDIEYPGDLFSPVALFGGRGYYLGISLEYPLLEYKHEVMFNVQRWVGTKTLNLMIDLKGQLPPHQTRTYKLHVRVVPSTVSWLQTFIPYRNFFRDTYGPVTLVRDPRPMVPIAPAMTDQQSPSNPFGYLTFFGKRPDLDGFSGIAELMQTYLSWGYTRQLIWPLSGLYSGAAAAYNYPSLMLTPLLADIRAQSLPLISALREQGVDIGFYQGYGSQIHFSWDDPRPVNIDTSNPDHLARAFAEIDLAYSLGGRTLGLDAFLSMPLWNVLEYLTILRSRYPGMRFIGELSPPDIFARENVSYLTSVEVHGPHTLADFLLPGHESLIAIDFVGLYGSPGSPTPFVLNWMKQYAEWGFVPLPQDARPLPNPDDYRARESWKTTVPQELRDPCAPQRYTD